jgi:hypothetical protein
VRLVAVVAAVVAIAVAGCGPDDGPAVKADWDLSSSHTMRDVHWSDPGIDALNLLPIESVHLRCPDGSVFAASSGIKGGLLGRGGPQPTLEIIDSAVDDKPAQVVLNFAWV